MRQDQTLIGFALLSVCLTFACTTRQVYQAASNTAPAADAININTATADELEQLPRIGPKTAANIIKFRTDNGPFRHVEELMQIKGMSEKKFLEIRQYLRTE